MQQIDGFKRRITDVFDVNFNAQPMFEVIDDILSGDIDTVTGLEELESLLKTAVEEYSNEYINCNIPEAKQIINEAKKLEAEMKQPNEDDSDELDEIYD